MIEKIIAVAIGGAIGATFRYLIVDLIQNKLQTGFPYGTMAVNIIGAFLIGFLMMYFINANVLAPWIKLFIITGTLGGFTTFSTFTYEFITLLQIGDFLGAGIYGLLSLLLGIIGCFLGIGLGGIIF